MDSLFAAVLKRKHDDKKWSYFAKTLYQFYQEYKPFIIYIFVYKFIMIYKKSEPKVEFEKFKEEDYILCKHEGFATMAIHEGC